MTEFIGVGFKFRGKTPECLREGGAFINLRPEPTNKYDPDAIAIDMDTTHVGYVSRENCKKLHEIMDTAERWHVELIETYPASAKLCIKYTIKLDN